jgi:hypothetical protein
MDKQGKIGYETLFVAGRIRRIFIQQGGKITDINTDKLSKTELEFLEQIAGYLDKNGEIACKFHKRSNKV